LLTFLISLSTVTLNFFDFPVFEAYFFNFSCEFSMSSLSSVSPEEIYQFECDDCSGALGEASKELSRITNLKLPLLEHDPAMCRCRYVSKVFRRAMGKVPSYYVLLEEGTRLDFSDIRYAFEALIHEIAWKYGCHVQAYQSFLGFPLKERILNYRPRGKKLIVKKTSDEPLYVPAKWVLSDFAREIIASPEWLAQIDEDSWRLAERQFYRGFTLAWGADLPQMQALGGACYGDAAMTVGMAGLFVILTLGLLEWSENTDPRNLARIPCLSKDAVAWFADRPSNKIIAFRNFLRSHRGRA
jgi:hypothetical protein